MMGIHLTPLGLQLGSWLPRTLLALVPSPGGYGRHQLQYRAIRDLSMKRIVELSQEERIYNFHRKKIKSWVCGNMKGRTTFFSFPILHQKFAGCIRLPDHDKGNVISSQLF